MLRVSSRLTFKTKKRRRLRFGAIVLLVLFLMAGIGSFLAPQTQAASNPNQLSGFNCLTHFTDCAAQIISGVAYNLTTLLAKLTAVLFGVLVAVAGYNGFIDSDAVQTGWKVARDVCNMFFVMVLLVISFGTLFRMPQYRYTTLLRKFVIMAVLINFSLGITGFFIDIMQLIMMTFVNAFSGAAAGNLAHMLGLTAIFNLDPNASIGQVSNNDIMSALLLGLFMMIIAFIVILVMVLMLLGRIIALWILAVLSPFAYFLSTFPHTQSWAKKWWSTFWQYATIGPVLAFFLWLSLTITGSGTRRASELITTGTGSVALDAESTVPGEGGVLGAAGGATNAFISAVGTNESLLSFMIGIVLLVAGLTIASRAGVAGGSFAGSVASGIQKRGVAWPKAFGRGVANFGYTNLGVQRLAEGAAGAGAVALSRMPLLGAIPGVRKMGERGYARLAAAQKARKDEAKKRAEAIPTGTWQGRAILGGMAQPVLGGKWGGKWRAPEVIERRKAARLRYPAAAGKDLQKLIKETPAEELTLEAEAIEAAQDELIEQGTAIHLLNPAYAARIVNRGFKERKAARYDEREGRTVNAETGEMEETQQGRYLWNFNQREGYLGRGWELDEMTGRWREGIVPDKNAVEMLGARSKGKTTKVEPFVEQQSQKKTSEQGKTDAERAQEQFNQKFNRGGGQDTGTQGTGQQGGGAAGGAPGGGAGPGGGGGRGRRRGPRRPQPMADIGIDPEMREMQERAITNNSLVPDAMTVGSISKGVAEGVQRARLLVNFSDPALSALHLGEHPTGAARLTGEEKDRAIPVLEGKYREQLQGEGVGQEETERLVGKLGTALRSAKELHLGNKMRFGTDIRTGLRHEDHHGELENVDSATLQEIFNELKPERQEEIKQNVRSQAGWGPDMPDKDVIKEYFATAAATFGRQKQYGPLTFREDERDVALQLKAAGVNIRMREEAALPNKPPLAAPLGGVGRMTARPPAQTVERRVTASLGTQSDREGMRDVFINQDINRELDELRQRSQAAGQRSLSEAEEQAYRKVQRRKVLEDPAAMAKYDTSVDRYVSRRQTSAQPSERVIESPISPEVRSVVTNTGIESLRNDLATRVGRIGADVASGDISYGLEQLRTRIEEVAREQGVAGGQLRGIQDELERLAGEAASPDQSPERTAALKDDTIRFLSGLRGGSTGDIQPPASGGDNGRGAA